MIEDFKKFAFKGNVIDLAVGVIIGGAFGKIVTSLVNDIIMPFIGVLLGGINFSTLQWIITPASEGHAELALKYGAFLQAIVDFFIIATSIFVFVKIITKVVRKKDDEPKAKTDEAKLLEEIRDLLRDKN